MIVKEIRISSDKIVLQNIAKNGKAKRIICIFRLGKRSVCVTNKK